mmetsp:Transcript_9601/g.23809  ORF Transcript_9601/g.23809 Transcript_9601/m.23809 type:complete len:93 (-) Transcript_9601:659-937(-)
MHDHTTSLLTATQTDPSSAPSSNKQQQQQQPRANSQTKAVRQQLRAAITRGCQNGMQACHAPAHTLLPPYATLHLCEPGCEVYTWVPFPMST